MYDITDVDSFARVKNWVRELRKIVGDDISICIAGNKKDLQKNAHVTEEEAEEYAASVGAQHIRTSAKMNQGVNEVFLALVQSESRVLFSSLAPSCKPGWSWSGVQSELSGACVLVQAWWRRSAAAQREGGRTDRRRRVCC